LILAALAADASDGIFFSRYALENSPDLDILQLFDGSGNGYTFKIPATPAGERTLATEQRVLHVIGGHSGDFQFEIPRILGVTKDEFGETGVLYSTVLGKAPSLGKLGPGEFTRSFAQTLAAIHSISVGVVRDAGLPDYDATSVLHQKVAELDKMAATGRVPADLLSRWEGALEDVGLYRFHPTVVHGSLNSESVSLAGSQVHGITNWASLRVGDPAEDFTWLMQGALENSQDDTLLHYRAARGEADENLLQRATLYAELEIGSWLVHCLEQGDPLEIASAEDLLSELRADLEAGNLRNLKATSFVGLGSGSLLGQMTSEIPVVKPRSDSEELF
jgi:aminoglycoside phosphotransferase (APT) family kinase protein